MFSVLFAGEVWWFALCVGIGSACVLDLWCLLCRMMGVVLLNWSIWGRWVLGMFHGYRHVCDYCRMLPRAGAGEEMSRIMVNLSLRGQACHSMASPRRAEILLGWLLHYLFAISYALALPLIWGRSFLLAPKLWQVLLICLGLSTLLSQAVIRLLIRGKSDAGRYSKSHYRIALVLAGHSVFAMAQYELALLFSRHLI